jgi:hypothetical protein
MDFDMTLTSTQSLDKSSRVEMQTASEMSILELIGQAELGQHAHAAQEWTNLAAVAVPLIRFGASDAGTESFLTIHRDIVGTHAVNLGIEGLLQRLRMHSAEKKD